MFSFFKKKENSDLQKYPDFWQEYIRLLPKENTPIEAIRFVVFDTETTGFNYANDRILSIGAVDIVKDTINLKNVFELFLEQDETFFNPKAVTIHGIRKHHIYQKYPENEAIEKFIRYISGAVLVGHHIGFDVKMINTALERMQLPILQNKTIDTGVLFKKTKVINQLLNNNRHYSLDDLCNEFNITMHDRHNAAGDALLTALVFLKIKSKLLRNKKNKVLNSL